MRGRPPTSAWPSWSCPAADLDGAVSDLVAALLSTDAAAARATKALLTQAPGNTLEQQAAAERAAQASAPGGPERGLTTAAGRQPGSP